MPFEPSHHCQHDPALIWLIFFGKAQQACDGDEIFDQGFTRVSIDPQDELVALAGSVSTADAAPTAQSYQVFDMLKQRSDEQVGRWRQVVKTDIAAFNQLVRQQDVPAIILETSVSAKSTDSSPNGDALAEKR